jgi:hypothetical protein
MLNTTMAPLPTFACTNLTGPLTTSGSIQRRNFSREIATIVEGFRRGSPTARRGDLQHSLAD